MENSLLERLRTRKGFTLIELLIVIVIIGILAVGLVPKVIDAPKKARDTVRKKDLDSIKIAVESYYADKNTYPAAIDITTLGSYFQGNKVPTDPSKKDASSNPVPYLYSKDNVSAAGATKCYVIGTQLESTTGGNSTEATAGGVKCDAVLAPANSAYYFTIGGNY